MNEHCVYIDVRGEPDRQRIDMSQEVHNEAGHLVEMGRVYVKCEHVDDLCERLQAEKRRTEAEMKTRGEGGG